MNDYFLQVLNTEGQVDRFHAIGFTEDEFLDHIVLPRQKLGYEIDTISEEEFNKLMSREITLRVVDKKDNPTGQLIIHYPYYLLTQEDIDKWEMLVAETKETKIWLEHIKDY